MAPRSAQRAMMGAMRVIAVTGLKGGVGKTSTAVNLAALSAASEGRRTLLWDLDPQGAATYCLDLKPKLQAAAATKADRRWPGRAGRVARTSDIENLEVVPADSSVREIDQVLSITAKPAKPLRRLLAGTKGTADVVILDCPPGLSARWWRRWPRWPTCCWCRWCPSRCPSGRWRATRTSWPTPRRRRPRSWLRS